MRCRELEKTYEILAGSLAGEALASPGPAATLREHAGRCPECAESIRLFEALEGSKDAFAVPEPHPSYWVRFSEGLEGRLSEAAGRTPGAPLSGLLAWGRTLVRAPLGASRRARFALALAAGSILVLSLLAIRHTRTSLQAPSAAGVGRQREEELLSRLGDAPREKLDEALDELAPSDDSLLPPLEDLAELEISSPDAHAVPFTGDSPYDLFLELGEEERSRLLEEIRGEMG